MSSRVARHGGRDAAAPAASPAPRRGPAAPLPGLPGLADGTELAGEFAGSGYRETPQIVYRQDGQAVRLPEMLYLVVQVLDRRRRSGAAAADARQVLTEVAEAVSRVAGYEFTADHIRFVLDRKLAPLGVTTYSDGSPPEVTRANPFLAFRFRLAVLPARVTWFLGGLFAWLYRPFVLVPALGATAVSEFWVFSTQNIGAAFEQTLLAPASILLVVALAIASAAFHEVGHGTACRYGGVAPGTTGCGIYLVWPAFYTDITNSYRLGRAGRMRIDLGGVYFNGLFIVALTLLYLCTGFQPLLIGILSVNLEIVQQLLPTLRFDGYYIIADLVGIPDLFKYIGPILRHTLLRQPADERLQALKRWPQIVVSIWVLFVIPVLGAQLIYILAKLPAIARADWRVIGTLAGNATASGDPVLGVVSACVQILLLLLPVAGVLLMTAQLLRAGIRIARRRAAPLLRPAAAGLRARIPLPVLGTGIAVLVVIPLAGVAWALAPSPRAPSPAAMSPPGQARPQASAPAIAAAGSVRPRAGARTRPEAGRRAASHGPSDTGGIPSTPSQHASPPTVPGNESPALVALRSGTAVTPNTPPAAERSQLTLPSSRSPVPGPSLSSSAYHRGTSPSACAVEVGIPLIALDTLCPH
jgi:putative peptide zinc metalloprotease protein